MRPRVVIAVAVLIALAAVAGAVARLVSPLGHSRPEVVHAALPPSLASYVGVYEPGSPPSYQPISKFTQVTEVSPNLVEYFSGWAAPFASTFATEVRAHGMIPFVQIDPTYASVQAIANGVYDSYLDSYADQVRDFGHAVIIGFGHEMNASWYSWGYRHVPAPTFVAAWRHIVTLFRGRGANNVTWLWTVNAEVHIPGYSTGPMAAWWPGAQYVTWVGIDGYYYRAADSFASVFGPTISQVRTLTSKPILLSETAVGPVAGQFAKIGDLFTGMRRYRTIGLVWFDENQDNGVYHQDWRIENDAAAEAAFRLGVSALSLVRP